MMKKMMLSSLVACMLASFSSLGQTTQPTTKPVGLKDAYAGKFLIGCAGDVPRGYSDVELAHIKAQYNVITPENCMKPQPTHPSENTYNWTTVDAMIKWCEDNNIKVHAHTLAWHSQTANWFFQPGPDGAPVTRELAMERLKSHIMTSAGRYKGKVISWDVVNEAIEDKGDGQTEALRKSSQWLQKIGPDFITLAFKWAHEADPGAELYYNDYSIDQGASTNSGKHVSSMALLKRLIADGAPIHGVGIQGHWHLDTNIADVEKAIENYESLGLKITISEMDVTATGTNSGALGRNANVGAITPENYQEQAKVYAKLFDIFNRHSKSITRVTLWGISDQRSWRANQKPLLFDAQLQPKAAYQAVLDIGLGK